MVQKELEVLPGSEAHIWKALLCGWFDGGEKLPEA
jgi:hypothetical protein